MEKFIINIGRQLGSGGKAIGEILAKEFGISVYDKKLIDLAAQESGFCKEIFEKSDEQKGLLNSLFNMRLPSAYDNYYCSCLSDESLFKIQSDVIRNLAEKESCIFIGRCADYILRDMDCCTNIFITADPADRITRMQAENPKLNKEQAESFMERTDRKRAAYYNYYSYKTWGEADTYHLCINSSIFGLEGTAELIKDFVMKKSKR